MDRKKLEKHIAAYEKGKCEYAWDELEEIITEAFDDGEIDSEEFDMLMERMMALEIEDGEDEM